MAMGNSIVAMAVNLIAMPFYLHFMGVEAYGLVGFYATLQAVSQVLDLGLAPTMNREIARTTERRSVATLLHTLGLIYLCAAVLLATLAVLGAPWIGQHWLSSEQLDRDTVVQAVMLMGVNLACRWPVSLYQAVLIGSDRLAASSAVGMVVNLSGCLVTILVLARVSPTIQAFFLVQAGMGFVQALILRSLAWRVVGATGARFDVQSLQRVWKFSAGMGGIAITSLVFTQLDKVLLSKLLDLKGFGYYMLAVLVVGGMQVFVSPAFNTIYPRFAWLAARAQFDELSRLYSLGTALLSAVLFPAALTLAFHAHGILTIWTGSTEVADRVAPLVGLLAVGSALNGIMHFPYALQLAYGLTRLPLSINIGLLILLAPMTVLLARGYGAMGGALAWVIVEAVYTVVGTWLTGRKIMSSAGMIWLLRDVGMPLVISLLCVLVSTIIANAAELQVLPRLAVAGLGGLFAAGLCLVVNPFSRHWVLTRAFNRATVPAASESGRL